MLKHKVAAQKDMTNYINDLLKKRAKRDAIELSYTLNEALNEAMAQGHAFSAAEQLAWHYCAVAQCDGIAEVLADQPESIPITAKFARACGLLETAEALDKVVAGIGADTPVSFSSNVSFSNIGNGNPSKLAIPWGAVDLLLWLSDEDLDNAILEFVAENSAEFTLSAPASERKGMRKKQAVANHLATQVVRKGGTADASAAILLQELLAQRTPSLLCARADRDRHGQKPELTLAISHRGHAPADHQRLTQLSRRYGASASALLELLSLHDGAALFIVDRVAALELLPSCAWPEHLQAVMEWAEQVTWADDNDEIPSYLSTAIPFAHTPGDSERWLLITEGAHASKIMLSDTDVLEDEPRFESLAEFMATLAVDPARILACGGHVCFDRHGRNASGGGACYYPISG